MAGREEGRPSRPLTKAERRTRQRAIDARAAVRRADDARDAAEALRVLADASDGTIGVLELKGRLCV